MSCDLENELAYHAVGEVVIGDNTVAYRSCNADVFGISAYHLVGFLSNCEYALGAGIIGDNRGLAEHDSLIAHCHNYV